MVSLSEIATFLLCIAVSCLYVLNTVLDFWQRGVSTSSPVSAVPVMLLALFTAYLMGVILVYIRVSPANSVLVSPGAVRRFAELAGALLLLFAMPLMPFHFLTACW